ncbi:MAG: hypothetical protein CL482_00415 [Acidobacteria bacterium]|nr:hypothetical protein [Acidobacteriota bacterium]
MNPREVSRMRIKRYAFAVLLVLGGCSGASTPGEQEADVGTEAATPMPDAPPPPYVVYVTNEGSGDLSVIRGDTHEVTATIPLGKRPRGIKVGPDGQQLFVALSGSPPAPPGVDEDTLPPPDRAADGVGIVDIAEQRVVNVLRAGTDPEQIAVSADGTRVFVANEDAALASIVDIATGDIVAELPVGGEPEGVTLSPDGRWVYVTSENDSQVTVIDAAALEVVTVFDVGARPRSSNFSPDSTRAYVTAENGGTVSVVDTSTHTVTDTVQLTGDSVRPMDVVVSPDGARVYVSTGRGRLIMAIDADTLEVAGSVEVGTRPWGIALTSDGRYLYAANGPSNDVSVVDTETLQVIATIPVGERPWGVAIVEN